MLLVSIESPWRSITRHPHIIRKWSSLNNFSDWIDYQTDQSLAWEIIEELGDGADIDSRGIVDIEQIIRELNSA